MTRWRRLQLATLVLSLTSLGWTQELPAVAVPSSEVQAIHILVGRSAVINAKSPLTRVLSSNPAAVEAVAISPMQVVVEGKAPGGSSLLLWDDRGLAQSIEVFVDLDVSGLRTAVEHAYPGQHIEVLTDGGKVILSGPVTAAHVSEELVKMASQYSAQVVNSLTIPAYHDRQVMLEVKFIEVDRARIDQLGFNFLTTGVGGIGGTIGTQQFGAPVLASGSTGTLPGKTPLSVSDLLNIFLFDPGRNLGVTIKALEQQSVLQILAEPNLMALNGEKATFLAGGEFPFPVVQSGQGTSAVTIQFRPFGVKLDFTANIGADRVIRLRVAPEVSALDFTNAVTVAGSVVPAISTRRAETAIELRDGQSFGIAGLLDNRATTELSKVPGIGSIPILGQLFHSKNVNRTNSELLVLVTPHIVNPIEGDTVMPKAPAPVVPFLDRPKFDETVPGNKDVAPPTGTTAGAK